jgi:ABC-type polysaccharide/polyol phosphate transport system ATPase subunit
VAEPRIVFDRVWKRFRRGERHDSLRDLVPAALRRLAGRPAVDADGFWALRDVAFEVRPGEALGIIGANGAGKSTVLKILTRILRPTRGRCVVRGRVGALIEVAAGFHADLTGRENVYLQGAIMGMRRAEIARRFDEIVEFAGVGEFIDTPVKRYSSGMNARLGFSIAAHLEPEVLLIDEVLAVGDLAFQQKAFGRVREIVARDIAVVVVSHQLDRVAALCSEAILLDRGTVAHRGSPAACIAAYVAPPTAAGAAAPGDGPLRLTEVAVWPAAPVPSGGRVTLAVAGTVAPAARPCAVVVRVRASQTGQVMFVTSSARCGVELPAEGPFTLEVDLQMNVAEGVYFAETAVRDRHGERTLGSGPTACIQVRGGPGFGGPVQMNPAMRVVADRAAPDAASG